MRARNTALTMFLTLSLLVQGLFTQALAWDSVKFTPTVSARETYDTNVNFMGKSDLEHSVAPGVRVAMEQDRMAAALQARGTAYKYTRLNEFDRIDQNYDGALQFNATERVTLDLKGGIVADHAYTSSLTETGELSKRASHQVYSVSPSLTYKLDELTSLTMLYAFSKTVYDTQDYTDSASNTAGLILGRWLNERTQVLLQVTDTIMDTDAARYNNLSLMTGFEYQLVETLKARLLLGASNLHTRYDVGIKRSSTDFSVDSSLEWEGERMNVGAGYNRDVTLGVAGDDLVRDKFSAHLTHKTAEKLQLTLDGYLTRSKSSTTTSSPQDNSWLELQPGARYALGEKTFLSMNYAYGASKDEAKDELKTRSRVSLEFKTTF